MHLWEKESPSVYWYSIWMPAEVVAKRRSAAMTSAVATPEFWWEGSTASNPQWPTPLWCPTRTECWAGTANKLIPLESKVQNAVLLVALHHPFPNLVVKKSGNWDKCQPLVFQCFLETIKMRPVQRKHGFECWTKPRNDLPHHTCQHACAFRLLCRPHPRFDRFAVWAAPEYAQTCQWSPWSHVHLQTELCNCRRVQWHVEIFHHWSLQSVQSRSQP